MESTLKSTEEFDMDSVLKQAERLEKSDMFFEDSHAVKNIVNSICKINIDNPSRKRDLVEGRMIYARLMRTAGHTVMNIGRSINKDHATIIHYSKMFDFLMQTVRPFRINYERCSSLFFDRFDVDPDKDYINYKSEYKIWKEEAERMRDVVKKAEELQDKYSRVKHIMEMIIDRTPAGKEVEVLKKINTMFNGLNT